MRSDNELRIELKKLQGLVVKKWGGSPYAIFRESELELLIKERPTTILALSQLKGYPATGARVKNYGQMIIDVINGRDAETAIDGTKTTLEKDSDAQQNLGKMSTFSK